MIVGAVGEGEVFEDFTVHCGFGGCEEVWWEDETGDFIQGCADGDVGC